LCLFLPWLYVAPLRHVHRHKLIKAKLLLLPQFQQKPLHPLPLLALP